MRIFILSAFFLSLMLAAEPEVDPQLAVKAQGVLKDNCLKCHGPDKQKGGLRLDSAKSLLKGGKDGVVVVPGELEKSPLIQAVGWTDPDTRMPPKKKLSDEQIALLTAWVKAGAPWPAESSAKPVDKPKP